MLSWKWGSCRFQGCTLDWDSAQMTQFTQQEVIWFGDFDSRLRSQKKSGPIPMVPVLVWTFLCLADWLMVMWPRIALFCFRLRFCIGSSWFWTFYIWFSNVITWLIQLPSGEYIPFNILQGATSFLDAAWQTSNCCYTTFIPDISIPEWLQRFLFQTNSRDSSLMLGLGLLCLAVGGHMTARVWWTCSRLWFQIGSGLSLLIFWM